MVNKTGFIRFKSVPLYLQIAGKLFPCPRSDNRRGNGGIIRKPGQSYSKGYNTDYDVGKYSMKLIRCQPSYDVGKYSIKLFL